MRVSHPFSFFLGYIFRKVHYHTDPQKIQAVKDWPIPTDKKELQRFLGFSNFYRRFIKGYSQITVPLTRFTACKNQFNWTSEVNQVFSELKRMFCSTHILHHPDPQMKFIVEVDASDSGAGAVISQRVPIDNKVHPCAFFSKLFSMSEQNCNVGNRELLAIKMVLEEWQQWLEGTNTTFVIWTDHKNLAYLQEGKRLNPRQARWALFSHNLSSLSLTVLGPKMSNLMPFHDSFPVRTIRRLTSRSYSQPVSSELSHGPT